MDNPTLSVIVPVYNAEKTLKTCVYSILKQSYKDFELILINDGSKDESPQICEEYSKTDSRVIVIHKENGGVSSARNAGLDIARGKWITFIDSDDYISAGYFDKVEDSLDNLVIKKYQWLKRDRLHPGTDIIKKTNSLIDLLSVYIADSIIRCPWGKFYRKDILDDLRFLPDMKIGEDAQFVFRYLAKCQSYSLLPSGEYIVRTAEEPDEVKYAITVDYAVNSLQHLFDAYEELIKTHPLGHAPFARYLAYFKRISKPDWGKMPSLWYRNKDVYNYYQIVWNDLSFKQKVKFWTLRLLYV